MASIFESSASSETVDKITQALTDFYQNNDNIQFKTDLSSSKIDKVLKIEFLNHIIKQEFDIDLNLKSQLTEPYKEHLVSHKRKGRIEFFDAVKALLALEQKKEGGLKKMLGL